MVFGLTGCRSASDNNGTKDSEATGRAHPLVHRFRTRNIFPACEPAAGKGGEDRWRAGLWREDCDVLGPENPGITVCERRVELMPVRQGVGRDQQYPRASGQELTLNKQGAQGARCAVRLRGERWSVPRAPPTSPPFCAGSFRARARGQTGRQRAPAAAPAPGPRRDALKLCIRAACVSPARCAHALASSAVPLRAQRPPLRVEAQNKLLLGTPRFC